MKDWTNSGEAIGRDSRYAVNVICLPWENILVCIYIMFCLRSEDVRACDGKNSRTKKEKDGLSCTPGCLASGETDSYHEVLLSQIRSASVG